MPNSKIRGRRPLTNQDVWEAVARFMVTGNPSHLPLELRREAEGIRQLLLAVAMAGPPPWLASAARPHPGPGASFADEIRAVLGDRADADSGLTAGEAP